MGLLSWRSSVLACALIAMVTPVSAQQKFYVFSPGSSRPSVIVDLSVLEKLGPQPTLPGMLRSGRSSVASTAPGGLLPPPSEPPRSKLSLPKGFSKRLAPTTLQPLAKIQPTPPMVTRKRRPVPAVPSIVKPPTAAAKVAAAAKASAIVKPARSIPKPLPPAELIAVTPKTAIPDFNKPAVPPPTKLTKPVIPKPAPLRRSTVPPPPVVSPAIPPTVPPVQSPPLKSQINLVPSPSVPPPPIAASKVPQVASAKVPTRITTDGTIRIGFGAESSELPTSATGPLDKLIAQMSSDADLRVQLHGYANGASDSPSQARRLSLFRALSVRTYLMKKGVRSTRIDVRALGNSGDSRATNRVDVIIQTS